MMSVLGVRRDGRHVIVSAIQPGEKSDLVCLFERFGQGALQRAKQADFFSQYLGPCAEHVSDRRMLGRLELDIDQVPQRLGFAVRSLANIPSEGFFDREAWAKDARHQPARLTSGRALFDPLDMPIPAIIEIQL